MQKQLERITFLKIQISVGLFAAAAREEKKQKPAFLKIHRTVCHRAVMMSLTHDYGFNWA